MKVAIYRLLDGKLLRIMDVPNNHVSLQCRLGEEFFLNCPDEATHIINNEPVTIIPEPVPPTPAEIAKRLTDTAQLHLDSVARSRNYDGILSLCSYANSTDLTFKTEAEAGITWRDSVWRFMYGLQTELTAGTRDVPTDAELIAMLPVIVW